MAACIVALGPILNAPENHDMSSTHADTFSQPPSEVAHAIDIETMTSDFTLSESPRAKPAPPPVPHNQKIMDKVANAFHHACDLIDIEVAAHLIQIMDRMVHERSLKADGTRRRAVETLVTAHERLWELRYGEGPTEVIAEVLLAEPAAAVA